MARKKRTPWLPQKGKKIEVRNPVTGRMTGVSEHKGFAIMMTIGAILLLVAIALFFR